MKELTEMVMCVETCYAERLACNVSSLEAAKEGRRINYLDILEMEIKQHSMDNNITDDELHSP